MEAAVGKGGMPLGIVIKDGKLLNGGLSSAQPLWASIRTTSS